MRTRTIAIAGGCVAAATVASILTFGKVTQHEEISCSTTAERNRVVLYDLSSSGRTDDIVQDRLRVVRQRLGEGGVCGGPVVVQAWTTGGTAVTLWSQGDHLDISGGTEKARENRIGPALDKAMDESIVPKLQKAMSELPADQSDFTYWVVLAHDAIQQLASDGNGRPTDVWVLSDGVQVDDHVNLNQALSVDDATHLATTVPVRADLTAVNVYLVGIAHLAGPPPPAGGDWTDAVRAFAESTCEATKATCAALNSSIDQPTS